VTEREERKIVSTEW